MEIYVGNGRWIEDGGAGMEGARLPFVSVVIPVRNEHKYIRACLDSVLRQDYPRDRHEVLLAVGPSTDDTEAIIGEYEVRYDHIHMLKNPRGTISCGVNIGIRAAKGEYIVRLDAHTEFAEDYISKCIEYLLKTGAENVGGPTAVKGKIRFSGRWRRPTTHLLPWAAESSILKIMKAIATPFLLGLLRSRRRKRSVCSTRTLF